MEAASQNRRAVSAKIAELYARYPLDKYVWIMPRLDTASELPEHIDLMVQTRKFSSNENHGDVYPQKSGGLSLRKSALMALAADAGIKWVPNLNGRTDDGSDPDIIEWKATGILAGLSGMTPVTATKRIDFAHLREMDKVKYPNEPNKVRDEDFRRKEFGLENAESKAQLRVIRSILGIPHKLDKATIDNKAFAVLRIIFAPNAVTPRERLMILDRMSAMYLGAYPGAEIPGGAAQIETGDQVREISPHDVHAALPEAGVQPIGGQPVSPSAEIPYAEEIEGNGDPPPERTTTDNFEFLKSMKELKDGFVNLLGEEDGGLEYYAVIHEQGAEKSNQIVDEKKQKAVYRTLRDRLALLTQNAGQVKKEPENADGDDIWIYKPIRSALGEFAPEALEKSLTDYYNEYAYPIGTDPKGIKAMLIKKKNTKGALIEAHVLILKWNKEQGVK